MPFLPPSGAVTRLIAASLVTALVTGCQAAPVAPGAPGPSAGPAVAAPSADTLLAGRAMVGAVPLANAEIVVFDPIADAAPAAPGAGDGIRLEARPQSVRTDADGRFTLSLTLEPGQAAEVYVSDGAQSVCGVLVGARFAVRNAGKTPIDSAHPLLLDIESTTTAGVMLANLKALGKAAAKRRAQGPDAVLALQARALDTMAGVVGETAAKLAALAGTADLARTIAKHMLQADPRLPPSAKRAVLDVVDGANPVLDAVVRALGESGAATPTQIRQTLAAGETSLRQAEQAAFQDDAAFVTDLAAEREAETTQPPPASPPQVVPDGVPPSGSAGGNGDSGGTTVDATADVKVQPGQVLDQADSAVVIGTSPAGPP
jgi:hypothetical protein